MPGTWLRPSSAISRNSHPSICPSIDPPSMLSFTSSRPLPPTRSTRSSPSSTFNPDIVSKPQPEKPLIRVKVLPESVFFIQGQKGQKRPLPLEIGRNQTTYRALQATAHLQYGTEKGAFARRRRLLEFGVAMAPE